MPGGDVNPYLGIAAMIAGGLYGLDHDLELGVGLTGNVHLSDFPSIPRTLREARQAFASSQIARPPSETTSSITTPPWLMSSWTRSTQRSPIGSSGAASKECENGGHDGGGGDARQAGDRPQHLSRAGCLVGMEHVGRPAAVGLHPIG